MSLNGALSVANSGLANVQAQFAVVSQNVANASTPGYATETATQQAITAGGQGMGVLTGPTMRQVNAALEASLTAQNSTVSGLQTQQSALQAIDAVQGAVGSGNDLASQLGNLQSQFSTLLGNPGSQAAQTAVVGAAQTLAQGINSLGAAYTSQRQTAEDNIVSEVGTVNTTLGTIGSLSKQIISLKADGQSTADLENQRDAAVQSLSQLVSVQTLQQPNGDMLVMTSGGASLPIHSPDPLSVTGANMEPGSFYAQPGSVPAGTVPGIMLGTTDVTGQLQGGQIGANITLRDTTMPTFTGELDEFSQNLASVFKAAGVTLFSNSSGNVPQPATTPPVQAQYVGFSSEIQVNPAVQGNPSGVVNGYPVNGNTGGLAGYTATVSSVLAALNTATPTNVQGLGVTGTLAAPYGGSSPASMTLSALAGTMVSAQSQASATVTDQINTEQAVQTTLSSQLTSQDGVSLDAQMSLMIQLQNAYGANAKVMSTVQTMFTALLNTVS
jgi:flagellar hook-associated protein 1 FlgK